MPSQFCGDKIFLGLTKIGWNASSLVRLTQGAISFVCAFVLALQAETVFDVLLNFLGVEFISKLDDHAFHLSTLGYFGHGMEYCAIAVKGAKFRKEHKIHQVCGVTVNRHLIGEFFFLSCVISAFLYFVAQQNAGKYSIRYI